MDTVIIRKSDSQPTASYHGWRMTAWISGGFTGLLAVLMLISHWGAPAHDPLTASSLMDAKEAVRLNHRDEGKKVQFRELDLQVREGFFLALGRNMIGGWLLLGGLVMFVVAARKVAESSQRSPQPMSAHPAENPSRERRLALASVGGLGALTLLGLVLGATVGKAPQLVVSNQIDAPAGPSEAERLANWPRFLGPNGNGIATSTNLPLSANAESNQNLLWKSEVPLAGPNSPVVWGNRVFLTGAVKTQRAVFCFDSEKGTLLWRVPVTLLSEAAVDAMNIAEPPGASTSTVATEGERVYAMFSTGEIIATDFTGKQIWAKSLGKPDNMYGHASSLVPWRDRVILQFDQAEAKDGKSRLIALDGRTGNVLWQKPRPVAASWTTPMIASVSGRELLFTLGEPFAIAYEPVDGKEVWRFGEFGVDLVPSPILAGDLMIAVDAGRQLVAIRADGQGDVSQTHGAWTNLVNEPDICTPVATGELLFALGSGGNLYCFQLSDGKELWRHNFKVEFQASPVLAGEWLYLFSHEGDMFVVKAAREFSELARSKLGEPIAASPAVVRDRLYVRGEKHLFCLGAGKAVADAR
jgi:outer membrane protein assembly factor BamB